MKANQWTPLEKRLWSYISPSEGCWEWRGSKNDRGYGRIQVNGKRVGAHRVVYESLFGPIPPGMFVCHSCDNPLCVRPDHLFLGTPRDNTVDMVSKGRQGERRGLDPAKASHGDEHWTRKYPQRVRRGAAASRSKLTEAQVLDIRRRYKPRMASALGREFGVSHVAILAIVKRKVWTHV